MKTLYITDLDGTLLPDSEKTSARTNNIINSLISRGTLITAATSRSEVSSSQTTFGIDWRLPMIIYNGAAMAIPGSGEIVYKRSFEKSDSYEILETLIGEGVYPIVYSFIDSKDRFSFIYGKSSEPQRAFIDTKTGDRRIRPAKTADELKEGEIFYFTCIGSEKLLRPLYERFKDRFRCLYEVNRYTGKQWLEIIPNGVSKAGAIEELKKKLGATKTVCFGDGINDIEMFAAADEGYAVKNAIPELKAIATGVIGSNNEDGVAEFIWRSGKC